MKHHNEFSDELLNAFIDNELDLDDRKSILEALHNDETLNRRICELQKVRNLLQLAYPENLSDNYHSSHDSGNSKLFGKSIAAGMILLMGLAGGWFAHQSFSSEPRIDLASSIQQTSPINNDTWKVVMHISSNKPNRVEVFLDEAENLLKSYQENNKKLQLEILANGDGIALLSHQNNPQVQRVVQLHRKYSNLILSACGNTISRLNKEGKSVTLLTDARVVKSALNQVIERQKQGWTYIHI